MNLKLLKKSLFTFMGIKRYKNEALTTLPLCELIFCMNFMEFFTDMRNVWIIVFNMCRLLFIELLICLMVGAIAMPTTMLISFISTYIYTLNSSYNSIHMPVNINCHKK